MRAVTSRERTPLPNAPHRSPAPLRLDPPPPISLNLRVIDTKVFNMLTKRSYYLAFACITLFASTGLAEDKSKVLQGPATAKMGDVAELPVPAGFIFLNGDQTRTMLRSAGDPVSGKELGFLRPTNGEWSVYFEFNDIGYIKDADKEKLDAKKLLQSYKDGTEAANEERNKRGMPPIEIVGWDKEPAYDPATHNLEWCMRARSEGHDFVNYNTRLLGRKGVLEVILVVEPENLAATLPDFRTVIASSQFRSGQSYAEYRPGDKIAKYGLGALVLGGAAVGAAKLGAFTWLALLFKKAWKLLVVGVAAIVGFFKKMFNKITGREDGMRQS
jgi:uncharacterized membrane-anchored protein